jgi:hypothetical protein
MKWIGQHIWNFVSRFRNDVYLEDLDASSGTSALVVDAQGKVHINTGLATGGGSEYVSLPVRFEEAVSKGDPVYISGYHGSVGPVIVAKADASSASHMPAFGLADADYTQNSTGHAISIGNLQDIDTSDYSVGDTLYVASGGGLTNVKPTGTNLIQNVATVSRSNANNGQLEVVATGRTNDVPAPLYIDHANQRVGIGTSSPHNKAHITSSGNQDGLLLDLATGSSGDYTGVYFKVDNNTTNAYKKGGLVWERTGSYNEGRFHFLLNNEDNTNNVDLTDSKLTILSTGNVGIGTTSPGDKLQVSGNIKIEDNNDLRFTHTGTGSYIDNYTGNLSIRNFADDSDILFQSDDGSGGVTTYLAIDGSTNRVNFNKPIKIVDSTAINIGSGLDLRLTHDGTDSLIQNFEGNLEIQQRADDKDIILMSDDGSGGQTAYLTLDGSAVANKFSEKVQIYKLDATANPRLSLGRQAEESINFDVEDRTARIYHRQDETTGNHVLKLTVDSDTSDTKDIHLGFRDADGSNEFIKFTVDESGNVGVGTTDPSEKLHIVGDLKVATNADAGVIHFGDTSDETKIVGYDSSDSNTRFDFFTSGSKKLTILDSGNVGIGTDSPSEKLEVDGNIKLSGNLDIEGSVQKQIQVFPMNFVDDLGTDKHFMPFVTANEQTANYQEEACMVMPADGRVVSVTVHYAQMHGAASDITVGIETSPCGQSYTNAWTIEETETISASADDDHHVFHFAFDNAKHFESTDKMALSIQQSVDLQNANRFFWVTAVIEYDWSTYLGGTSAEYPTTP